MSVAKALAASIKNLSSANQDTRESARQTLLTQSRTQLGANALFHSLFEILEARIEAGERGVVAICMSRTLRFQTAKKLDDWNLIGLSASRDNFYSLKKEGQKKTLLQAIRYFALAYPQEASLVEAAGWVQVALNCKQELQGPALLLLDALDSLVSLPAAIHGAPQTKVMLVHVFAKGDKPERCGGVRVALRVLAYVEQGSADGSLEPGVADAWRSMLSKTNIVLAVVWCIDSSATKHSVERSLHLLAQLSTHEVFLKTVRTEEVQRVLVNDVVGRQRLGNPLFAILHRVLTSRKAANVFLSIGGVGVCLKVLDTTRLEDAVLREMISALSRWLRHATRKGAADEFTSEDGLKICLHLLEKVDLKGDQEAAKGILGLLEAWSDKATDTRAAFARHPDLSQLLSFLGSQDSAIAESACVLVSWALHHQVGGRAVLAKGLQDEAITLLLPFLARPLQDARYAVAAMEEIIIARVNSKESADKLAGFGIVDRLLMVARDDSPDEMLGPGTRSLGLLAMYSTSVADQLVSKGAVRALVARLGTEEVTAKGFDKNTHIMSAVTFILGCGTKSVEVDIPAVQRLVEVCRDWSATPRWIAFSAICILTHGKLDVATALDDQLKKECIDLTVTILRDKLYAFEFTKALAFLDTILCEASASVGQTFIAAGGPKLLVCRVKLEDVNRDSALRAVLSIANNENLHNVMDDLLKHAGMAVADMCNTFPPSTSEAAMELQRMFWDAFKQYPQWAPTEGTITEEAS